MARSRRSQSLLLVPVATAVLALVALPEGALAEPPPTVGVHLTRIGAPTWQPVDVHLFAAPVGTGATGYAEFGETMAALLPPPRHEPHPDLGIGPGVAHLPPYDGELAAGVTAQGFDEGVRFHTGQFSEGMGVWTVFMNVPRPGTVGASPDFLSGPIIPNSLFPIHVTGASFHNGRLFATLAEFDVPALDASTGFPGLDGHSHFPVFLADNADFGPSGARLNGSYRWEITMTDTSGAGWVVTARFTVTP